MGKGPQGRGVKPVPGYCGGLCIGFHFPESLDWSKTGVCIEYKNTVKKCFKRYGKFVIKSNFGKYV